MSTINLVKFDKFLAVFLITLFVLAAILVYTFKSVFSAFTLAYSVDQNKVKGYSKIDKETLANVYKWAFNKETIQLTIRD